MAFLWVRPKQVRDESIKVFYIVAGQAGGDDGDAHDDQDSDDEEDADEDSASDDAEDDTGAVLGERYELLEAIAWGGTAAVYRALDQVTKAQVAVKVLCSGVRAQLGRYFGQEGRLAAQLYNPHLVRAHHFGVDEGRPFIVFDLVPGRSLPGLYFKQPMPWRELCAVVLGLLDALGTMHLQGIVHRDVKPDNVVVWRRPNHPDHVTLLDVGFAAVPPERNMTNAPEPTGMVFGTYGYIAPELFAGHLPDPRSDLYSVGALMYEMLTSLPVTDLGNAPEILAIAPPRVVAPGADIPEAVEDVVMQALSDIEARFQSSTAMAAAIREALAPAVAGVVPTEVAVPAAVPVPAVVPAPVEVRTPAPGRRAWLMPAMLVLGVLLGGGGVFGVMSTRTGTMVEPRTDGVAGEATIAGPMAQAREERMASQADPEVDALLACVGGVPSSAATPRIDPSGGPDAREPGAGKSEVLAAAQGPEKAVRPGTRRRPALATGPVEQGVASAMGRLEPAARRCAREHGVVERQVHVEVRRRAGGAVDSVRVWDMSMQHPFVQCIDKIVRGARLPDKDAPVESYEFFGAPR